MNEQALSLLLRAKSTLDHVDPRTQSGARAVESVRKLIEAAERELTGASLPPAALPAGARQGISVEPRAEWRRR